MMAVSTKALQAEEGLMQSAYEWLAGIEESYRLFVVAEIRCRARKGVYIVRMRADTPNKDNTMRTVACVSQEWPTASYQSVGGLFLALATKLDRLVGDWALDTEGLAADAAQDAGSTA